MKIALIAAGSRGDVQPIVALGGALVRAGHAARLVTHPHFDALARAHGLELRPVHVEDWPSPENYSRISQLDAARHFHRSKGPVAMLRAVGRFLDQLMPEFTRGALAGCEGADLIGISGVGVFAGHSIAQKLGVPYFMALLQPVLRTAHLPSPILPPPPFSPPGYNRFSHWAGEQLMWRLLRAGTDRARAEVLGLGPYPGRSPYPAMYKEQPVSVIGVSPAVIGGHPPDWSERFAVTGYWFADEPHWAPPAALERFLASGPPPVCVGFGSMPLEEPERFLKTAVEALERAGQRGVILGGWSAMHAGELPATVLGLDAAPHAWLYPRCAAAVHHGGAGTTGAAFRAGVPQVVVPFLADQPFWASRVVSLGAGPRPVPVGRLTAKRLAKAIGRAVSDPEIRARANAVGEQVRAEDGAARAAEVVAGFFG